MDKEMMDTLGVVCSAVDLLMESYSSSEEKDPLIKAFLTDVCRARSRLMSALMRRQDESDAHILEAEI